MKEIAKCSGYYFLILQLHVFASLLVRLLLEFFLAFFVKNIILFLTIEMIVGLVTELLLCAFFINHQIGKRTSPKEVLLPLFIALALRFLLALITKFYVFTAGVPANTAVRIWETVVRGELVDMADIAFWKRIVTFIPMQALLFAVAYISCRKKMRMTKNHKTASAIDNKD